VISALAVLGNQFTTELYRVLSNPGLLKRDGALEVTWSNQLEYLSQYQCRDSYSMQVIHRDPLIIYVDNFLIHGEADYIRNISQNRMMRSYVAESAVGNVVSNVRTSSSAFLDEQEDAVVSCIEARASKITGIPLVDCEPLQVVRYYVNQQYEPHFDYFPRHDLVDPMSKQSGQRYVTVLAYVNDGMAGGVTVFPKLQLSVTPRKGAAVMWYNVGLDEIEDHRTLHGGMPVVEGEKWAINIWQRKKIPGWDSKVTPQQALNYTY